MSRITRTVWMLSLVSLCADLASEMLYPIMPVYLRSIGFSVFLIGILEGLAEALAGLSKGYFGNWSDRIGKRLPFVQFGYALSAISKPMLGAFTSIVPVFLARTTDRLGKGIRTAARDAMLSDESDFANKGKIFGFHRSMDTVGAIGGPIIALVWLYFFPKDYRMLFLIAVLPGLVSVLLTLKLKEKTQVLKSKIAPSWRSLFQYRKFAASSYRKITAILILFTLFNSSDVFLLLRVKEAGHSDISVVWFYIFFNLIYAIAAYPFGIISDKIGFKKILVLGLGIFALVYLGFAWNNSNAGFYFLFALYGLFVAATEGLAKAWVSNLCRKEDTATAIGSFLAFQSIAALLASLITGFLWSMWGPVPALMFSAAGAVCCILMLVFSRVSDKERVG